MWLIGLEGFILISFRDRVFSTAIFTGSALTVHKSFKMMFRIALFGVIQAMIDAYQCCVCRFWNMVLLLLQ